PLARQFVEAHGGTIQLQSREGEGTTVTIRLPRTAEQRADYEAARVAE
ncbi:MAG: ATP-binding protein, partial [Sphingomonadaceae bacterium]|nr:ATP-binding protein [Sphingomonadaceae bacterium]